MFSYLIDTIPEINHSLEVPIIAIIHLRKAQSEDDFEQVNPTDQKYMHYRFKDHTSSKIQYDNVDDTKRPIPLKLNQFHYIAYVNKRQVSGETKMAKIAKDFSAL